MTLRPRIHVRNREHDLLAMLASKVRFLSLGQVQRLFFVSTKNPARSATTWLKRLESKGSIRMREALVRKLPGSEQPLLDSCRSGAPSFGALSYALRVRWNKAPLAHLKLIEPGKNALVKFGRRAVRRARLVDLSHDLFLSEVYMGFMLSRPDDANRWVHEDCGGGGELRVRPDAFLLGQGGLAPKAIEIAGVYGTKKLEEMDSALQADGVPYEVW